MRRKIVMANWKMNKLPSEAASYIADVEERVERYPDVDKALAGQDVLLEKMVQAAQDTSIVIGAENVYWKERGAYTGETSPEALADLGIVYVIIGHSERRNYFRETDEMVNLKVLAALRNGLKPIVAIDEALQIKSHNDHMHWVANEVIEALKGVKPEQLKDVMFAYEPTQAIGSGQAMDAASAQKHVALIREAVADIFNDEIAQDIRIMYGGSVKPANAYDILKQADIDGVLVGDSALDPNNFVELVQLAHQASLWQA
jgi:triosephosphate isomerase